MYRHRHRPHHCCCYYFFQAQTEALTNPEWDLCQLHKARQRKKKEAGNHRRRRAIGEHEEDVMEDDFERQAIEVEDEVPPADIEVTNQSVARVQLFKHSHCCSRKSCIKVTFQQSNDAHVGNYDCPAW